MVSSLFPRWHRVLLLCVCLLAAWVSGAPAADYPEVMFILDGSGSMWGRAGNQTKIEAAKAVLEQVVPSLPPEVRVGLAVYGHRRKGDCTDIEVLIPPGSRDRTGLLSKAKAITPKGKTPIAAAIKQVAELLKQKENETTIVLVSDGIETCHADPCGVVKALKDSGIKFILHVVGFGVDAKAREQLSCLAQAGGGRYFSAGDAKELLAALEAVKKEVAVKVEKAKTTQVKAVSRLGKLKITIPQGSQRSLAEIRILRGDKVIKVVKPPASGTHPLLAGDYQVVLAFANPNYRPPTPTAPLPVKITGGQTYELQLGALAINIAKKLEKGVKAVVLLREGKPWLTLSEVSGNRYYLFTDKPVPPGTYDLAYLPVNRTKEPGRPVVLATGVKVSAGATATVTVDSGFQLKKSGQKDIVGWELVPAGGEAPLLNIRRRWDNTWPLWEAFPVPPGTYDLRLHLKGMKEPLPVGQGIQVGKGQTVVFDTGI